VNHTYYFSPNYLRRSDMALTLALSTAPAYRTWQAYDPGERVSVDERYAAMPVLTKKEIRESFPQGLVPGLRSVADGLHHGEIEYVQTSGTTEEKVTNNWNQAWWNASEIASWKLNTHTAHLDGTQREAQLASALSVGFLSEKDLPMDARCLDRFLFLNEKVSAREWEDRHFQRMVRELADYQPEILEVNPSLLARLCWWAFDHGVPLYQPKAILLTYEFISALHVRSIRKVFQSPLVSSYGATEVGYVFMECEHGTMHQNTEFCRVDFQPVKPEHGSADLGRILVTTFGNSWVSLVRFDVGDLGRLDTRTACPCGRREGMRLAAIEGRLTNVTFTTQGKMVTTKALDDALATIENLRDYFVEQNSGSDYAVKLVTIGSADRAMEEARAALRVLYGLGAKISLEVCRDLDPAASGKYRRTRVNFDYDAKGLLA
jgi:phenylacetate-CoA ligase